MLEVRVTVLIHPTLAKADAQQTLRKMEFNLGLRATASGHLVLPNGEHPVLGSLIKRRAKITTPNHGPYNGGGAAA